MITAIATARSCQKHLRFHLSGNLADENLAYHRIAGTEMRKHITAKRQVISVLTCPSLDVDVQGKGYQACPRSESSDWVSNHDLFHIPVLSLDLNKDRIFHVSEERYLSCSMRASCPYTSQSSSWWICFNSLIWSQKRTCRWGYQVWWASSTLNSVRIFEDHNRGIDGTL